jgi:hypothetical protein
MSSHLSPNLGLYHIESQILMELAKKGKDMLMKHRIEI